MSTIVHQYDRFLISQRLDGYVSLTDMAKASNKLVGHYLVLDSTNEFLSAMSHDIGIPISSLICVIQGKGKSQGTWAHPEVAIDFAQWCSVRFRIWANRTLRKIIESDATIAESDRVRIAQIEAQTLIDLQNLKHQQRLELFYLRENKKVAIKESIFASHQNYDKGLTVWANERLIYDRLSRVQVGMSEKHVGSLAADYLRFCSEHDFIPLRFNRFSRELVSFLQKSKQWILRKKRLSTGATIENLCIKN